MTSGELFVMMIGTSGKARWCAEPWTVARLSMSSPVPTLDQVKVTSGLMMSGV